MSLPLLLRSIAKKPGLNRTSVRRRLDDAFTHPHDSARFHRLENSARHPVIRVEIRAGGALESNAAHGFAELGKSAPGRWSSDGDRRVGGAGRRAEPPRSLQSIISPCAENCRKTENKRFAGFHSIGLCTAPEKDGPARAAEFFPGSPADRERLRQTVATVCRFLLGE
jgi:hypothetical protein